MIARDSKGNQIVIPGGFHLADTSGKTVEKGIVIEDDNGNQFVWIPVSNINHDGSNKIVRDNGEKVEITLGRYSFDSTTGKEEKGQYGSEYTTVTTVESYFQELSLAKDLGHFIDSVEENRGYYIGRYEASFASGSEFGVGNSTTYYKPASKKSTANSRDSMKYVQGRLWNFITRDNALKVSQQMYYGNSYVESDLVNSYMWDTAIVYIQAMGNSNYAYTVSPGSGLMNTGERGDERCKIMDMAGNIQEWSTEYSTSSVHCVQRGGEFTNSNSFAATRESANRATSSSYGDRQGFRVGLYIK